MFARVGIWHGSQEEFAQWIDRSKSQVKPAVQNEPGLNAAYWLVDRASSKGMIITPWETQAAMTASEAARAARQANMKATGATVTTERYEVIDSLIVRRTLATDA